MRLLELVYRVWIQDGFYNMMSNYHMKLAGKYVSDNSKEEKWTHRCMKVLYWNEKFWDNQSRINEIMKYYSEKLKGLI